MSNKKAKWFDPSSVYTKEDLISLLTVALAGEHDPEHSFKSHPSFPRYSVCSQCGFINPEGPQLECGHRIYDHVSDFWNLLLGLTADIEFNEFKKQTTQGIAQYMLGHTLLGETPQQVWFFPQSIVIKWLKEKGIL